MSDKHETIAIMLSQYIESGTTDLQRIELARNLVDSMLEILGDRDGDDEHDVLCGSALVVIDGRQEDACTCRVISIVREDDRKTMLWSDSTAQRWYSEGRREAAGAVRQALLSTGFDNDLGEFLVAAARGDAT